MTFCTKDELTILGGSKKVGQILRSSISALNLGQAAKHAYVPANASAPE